MKTKATKALSKMDENSVTMLSKPTQSSERGNNMHEFYNKSGLRNDKTSWEHANTKRARISGSMETTTEPKTKSWSREERRLTFQKRNQRKSTGSHGSSNMGKISIASINIHSIFKHKHELIRFLNSSDISIVAIQELWIQKSSRGNKTP